MRVVGGSLGGRRLEAPPGARVRPTSDRVREAVFNILGPPPAATRVLDAFAGTGALGIEALSRGAAHATFVDSSRMAVRCVQRNLRALGLGDSARVFTADASALIARWNRDRPTGGPRELPCFRWLFVDPPYRGDLADRVLALLGTGDLVDRDGIVVVEHDRRNPPADDHGSLVRTDRRRYGDTEVSFYRHP